MKSYLPLSLAALCFLSAASALRAQSPGTTGYFISPHMAPNPSQTLKPAKPTVAKPADLPPNVVEGTYANYGKKPVDLHYVTSFIDHSDPRNLTVIVIAEQPVSTAHWSDEIPQLGPDATAIVFWLEKGNVIRCDEFWHGKRKSTSGVYTLKLATLTPNNYSGTALTLNSSDRPKLNARLHVIVK